MSELGYCRPMSATISPRQCDVNRRRDCYLCQGCEGLENVQAVNFEEMVMSTPAKEPAPARRGRHLLCKVPGCDKLRVTGGMCKAHYRQSQAAKGAPETPAKKRQPVTSPPAKAGRLSALLAPPEPPATGYFLDMQDFPELDAWLKEMVSAEDIPLAIIGLLEARRTGALKPA